MPKAPGSDQNYGDEESREKLLKVFTKDFNSKKPLAKGTGKKRYTQSTLSEIYGNRTVIDLAGDCVGDRRISDSGANNMEVDNSETSNASSQPGMFGANLMRARKENTLSKAGALNQRKLEVKNKPMPIVPQSRKIVIQGFQTKPTLPPAYATNTWKQLESAITAVFEDRRIEESMEELYRLCESMCRHKLAAFLYEQVQTVFHQFMERYALQFASQIRLLAPLDLLKRFNSTWVDWSKKTIDVRSLLLFLDRSYSLQSTENPPLWNLGQNIFRTKILDNEELGTSVLDAAVTLLEQIRKSEGSAAVSVLRITNCIFVHLNTYQSAFEQRLFSSTRVFYQREKDRWTALIASSGNRAQDLEDYVASIHQSVASEAQRCGLYWSEAHSTILKLLRVNNPEIASNTTSLLAPTSRAPLVDIVIDCTVNSCLPLIFNDGLRILLDAVSNDCKSKGASLVYDLAVKYKQIDLVKLPFAEYIKTCGNTIVQDESPEKDASVVSLLLRFHEQVHCAWKVCFKQNEVLFDTLKDSFEAFVNQRPNRLAELLAKHMDMLLRPNSKAAFTAAELEAKLDDCLVLFKFIHGKDVFEAFYKNHLARRLLLNRSFSLETERSMLSKLRQECGPAFTSKLEVMFKDIENSRELLARFLVQTEDRKPSVALSVSVLSAGIWPTFPQTQVKLTPDLLAAQQLFCDFYMSNHTGRKMTWLPSLSNCVVIARFPRTDRSQPPLKRELLVTQFQAAVLEQFNCDEELLRLSFSQLIEQTQLDPTELKKTLLSLTQGKKETRVLVKDPNSKTVTEACTFWVNTDFYSPQYKVRISSIQLRETPEEQKQTREKAVMDRAYMVDAAIVRIMKARKSCDINSLSSSLFEQLKFPMSQADIKQRIESLIDREFIQRDPNNPCVFLFVA